MRRSWWNQDVVRHGLPGLVLVLLGIAALVFIPAVAIGKRASLQPALGHVQLPPTPTYPPTQTPCDPSCGGGPTGTPTVSPQDRPQASLYTEIDYPLQIAVNTSSTVTLNLSTKDNLAATASFEGMGTAEVNPDPLAVPLPTDLAHIDDVQAEVDVVGDGNGSLVWRPITPDRKSLLTPLADEVATGQPRHYVDATFQWSVLAVSSGPNTQNVKVSILYIYDGAEHLKDFRVTDAPLPIVAVVPTPQNTTLPLLRLPLGIVLNLAGLLILLHSLWANYGGILTAINAAVTPIFTLVDNVKKGAQYTSEARDRTNAIMQRLRRGRPATPPTAPAATSSSQSPDTGSAQSSAAAGETNRPDRDA